MDPSPDDILFGRLALHYKLITKGQLEEVSGLLALAGGRRQLKDILTEMGYLNPRQVEQILIVQRDYLAKKQIEREAAGVPSHAIGPAIAADGGEAMPPLVATASAPPAVAPPPERPLAAVASVAGLSPSWRNSAGPLDIILNHAVDVGASDIHIHAAVPLSFRINGHLELVDPEPIEEALAEALVLGVLGQEQQAALGEHGQVDFAYTLGGRARFRANAFRQRRGIDLVMRAIPLEPPTLEQLGLPDTLGRLTEFHQGMVLVTGPSGCGKSSTLAALVRILNESRRDHIITIEDPIEYLHPSRGCVVHQRQVGRHTSSFARALRAALREDPDIIAIGELRDLDTISLAISAAETGHLVLGTLHTNNAIRTVNRILGVFPPNLQEQIRTMLSESLRAVISQRLVTRADGAGRVPALEVMIATRAVSNLIRENKTFQIRSVLQTGATHGMMQLDTSLADLVKRRIVTHEEALRHAEDPSKIPA
jgi:twitching motility protein PilT